MSEGKIFYYARVSSKGQNLDRQLVEFERMGADEREIICDKESGKDFNRPGYQALKNAMLRSGDTLVVKSLDRLSRSKEDIKSELQFFKENNIRLKIIDVPTTMIDIPEEQSWLTEMVNNILIEVMSSIAQHERENIRARQREGIEAVRGKKHLGRPKTVVPDNWDQIITEWQSKTITAREAMKKLNMSKTVFYNLVRERKNKKTVDF